MTRAATHAIHFAACETEDRQMQYAILYRLVVVATSTILMLAFGTQAEAQTLKGQARALQSSIINPLGITTTVLADTGSLGGANDAREASLSAGSVPSIVSGKTLHATTIGWPDQVKSEASLANLMLTVGGVTVGAEFAMARASAVLGLTGSGSVNIDGLSINGLPITVTGNPNQIIAIPGGRVVINEQSVTLAATVVNALHIAVTGVADVVVASATAGIR
jgi:hypothetical protein